MYKILSIDGGGMRGLIPATILAAIERRAGKPIGTMVDLVAGTSTGGIIAAAVAAGIPMERVRQLYREQGGEIFSRGIGKRIESLGGLRDEKYPAEGIERCLKELFQGRKLSEATTDLLVCACDLSGSPFFFKRKHARNDPNRDFQLADVCRATSAAPTYFPPAEIRSLGGDELCLIDGGLAANSPAMCAVAESFKRGEPFPWLLSLGTGADCRPMTVQDAESCGLLNGGPSILRMAFNGPGNAVDCQCRELLGERYVRLQAELPRAMDMDATDEASLSALEGLAGQIIASDAFEAAMDVLTRQDALSADP